MLFHKSQIKYVSLQCRVHWENDKLNRTIFCSVATLVLVRIKSFGAHKYGMNVFQWNSGLASPFMYAVYQFSKFK